MQRSYQIISMFSSQKLILGRLSEYFLCMPFVTTSVTTFSSFSIMLLIRVGSDYSSSSASRVVLLCHMLGSSSSSSSGGGTGPVVAPRIRARISLAGVLMASVSREARRGESWLVVARRSRPALALCAGIYCRDAATLRHIFDVNGADNSTRGN